MNFADTTAESRCEKCFALAAKQFEQNLGFAPQSQIELRIVSGPAFAVSVAEVGEAIILSIPEETVEEIDRAWELLWETPILNVRGSLERLSFDYQKTDAPEDLADLSLVWLLLHELTHLEMGHLAFAPEAHLVEVGLPQSDPARDLPAGLDERDLQFLDKCFEMQADSEATDVFLGLYDKTRWNDLRLQAVCIFVVMALIERENIRLGNKGITHPRAGTRFFTLMGHLFQMWLYPNATLDTSTGDTIIKTPELPNAEEFQAYVHAVLTPLVGDAAYVAGFCEAHSFLQEIGGQGTLFQDIFTAQYGEDLTEASFITDAGKEWLLLRTVNEKMMAASGHRD